MDIMTAHRLLTMLELLDEGWKMEEFVIKEDERIIVTLYDAKQAEQRKYEDIIFYRR